MLIHECFGPVFDTFRWSCANEDNMIFLHQLCDKRNDCDNGSDERNSLCIEADFDVTLGAIYCVLIYLITGSIIYVIIDTGTQLQIISDPLNDSQENNKNKSLNNVEKSCKEEEGNNEEEDMVNKLDFLFDICKHYCNSVKKVKKIKYEHKRKVIDAYGKCHLEGEEVFRFFHCLKCLSLDPTFLKTCQLIVDEIYMAEIDHHHCGNIEKALLCIKQHLR